MQDHKECDVSLLNHSTCKRIENSKAVDLADNLECRFQSVKERSELSAFGTVNEVMPSNRYLNQPKRNSVSWRRSGPSEAQDSQVLWRNTIANRTLSNLIRRFAILSREEITHFSACISFFLHGYRAVLFIQNSEKIPWQVICCNDSGWTKRVHCLS